MNANEVMMTKKLKDAFHELYDDHEKLKAELEELQLTLHRLKELQSKVHSEQLAEGTFGALWVAVLRSQQSPKGRGESVANDAQDSWQT